MKKAYLSPTSQPTWPAQPGHRSSELLAGQAGRQVLDGEHRMGATHLLAASLARLTP